MLEIQKIRQDAQPFIDGLKNRNIKDAAEKIEQLLTLDQNRRDSITELEQLRNTMNQSSKSIGKLMKEGKKEEAEAVKSELASSKERIKDLEQEVQTIESSTYDLLTTLPNIPHPSVPLGKDASDNAVISQNDIQVTFNFTPKPHWDLALEHDIIDWKLGVKLTGSGFPVYKGKGAILQRALINFFLTKAREAGYTEIMPPLMINEASGFGTGQLPDKEGQMYHVGVDDLYLIPTAEVPVTNMFRGD
ncbi:MAG: serine--tRNA ligase, partial [Bacteroidetes bacterium]|nr:serine--tRNA ligase [Bacteroidota bacterium]